MARNRHRAPMCNKPKCCRSVIISHLNGNTLDNRVVNLDVVGFLPVGNHRQRDDCHVNPRWHGVPVLTPVQCDVLRASGQTTDIDARSDSEDEGENEEIYR